MKEVDLEFERAMSFVAKWEGGYVNHPSDPGGETKYGISKRAYPKLDIKNLTMDQAKEIYFKDYWLKAGCDNYKFPVNMILFDCAVNMGVGRALKFLAEVGPLPGALLGIREEYYEKLATRERFKPFLKGWMNRLNDLKRNTNHG